MTVSGCVTERSYILEEGPSQSNWMLWGLSADFTVEGIR